MKLRLAVNIGVADARRLELDEVREGSVVEVGPDAAEEMLAKGWAVEPTPRKVKGVPARGVEGVPE